MKNLIECVKIRAKLSGRQLLSFDELTEFPAEQGKELEGTGVLFQIKDADGIICTECDKHCWKPVETRQKDGEAIGVIYCEDADCGGLIEVELERLQQWEIVKEKLLVLGYVAASTDKPLNVFRKQGDMWEVKYKGKATNVKHQKGMLYIDHLLRNAKKQFKPLELKQMVDPPETVMPVSNENPISEDDSAKKQGGMSSVEANAIADKEALREYHDRLKQIEPELEEARGNSDQATKEKLLKEKDAILEQLGSSKAIRGQLRQFSGNEAKVKGTISTAIKRAINSIKKHNEELSEHLNSNIKRGNPFCYSSEPEVDWHFE